jgi:hypothetical protein
MVGKDVCTFLCLWFDGDKLALMTYSSIPQSRARSCSSIVNKHQLIDIYVYSALVLNPIPF